MTGGAKDRLKHVAHAPKKPCSASHSFGSSRNPQWVLGEYSTVALDRCRASTGRGGSTDFAKRRRSSRAGPTAIAQRPGALSSSIMIRARTTTDDRRPGRGQLVAPQLPAMTHGDCKSSARLVIRMASSNATQMCRAFATERARTPTIGLPLAAGCQLVPSGGVAALARLASSKVMLPLPAGPELRLLLPEGRQYGRAVMVTI
jgi:hypothetical protein